MRTIHLALTLLTFSGLASAQVLSSLRLAENENGVDFDVCNGCRFGSSVANLGDLDGDGVEDFAVGVPFDTEGGVGTGSVWILFLNPDATVKAYQKINETNGGFGGSLSGVTFFGSGVAGLGDLDGDGFEDLLVGSDGDTMTGFRRGAAWILFLRADGTVKSEQKIEEGVGGFGGTLADEDRFGRSVANIGDLDGDGVTDVAVGAIGIDGPLLTDVGGVWILFLNSNGTVKGEQLISDSSGGLVATFKAGDEFGGGMGALGDFDADGVEDLAVGSVRYDPATGAAEQDGGGVYILFMNADGTVKSSNLLSQGKGGFTGDLTAEFFGTSIALGDDMNDDGVADLYVGGPSHFVDDGILPGAVWLIYMNADGTANDHLLLTQGTAAFPGPLFGGDAFGSGLASCQDFDGSGKRDIFVGALGTDMGGLDAGAAWVISMKSGIAALAGLTERIGAGNLTSTLTVATGGNFSPPTVGGNPRFQLAANNGAGHDQGLFFAFDTALDLPILGSYTLLCIDGGSGVGEILSGNGIIVNGNNNNLARYVLNIPVDGNLVGFEFTLQGILLDSTGTNRLEFANAYDMTVGL